MPTECIHGLDIALCDVCSPAKLPEPVGRATRAPARVPGTSRAATARAAARGTAREKPLPKVDIAAQRIYHVTHLDNLEAIVAAGAILADELLDSRPAVDVSAPTTREHRRAVQVKDGVSVAGFVPFFLSPDAALWADLRGERVAPHWSPSAQGTTASQFVVLVGSLASAPVLSDGDASHVLTRFTEGDALVRTFARLLVDEPALRSAEALVPERFPLDGIATVGVASVARGSGSRHCSRASTPRRGSPCTRRGSTRSTRRSDPELVGVEQVESVGEVAAQGHQALIA
ncbi:DarT ssDNA thymidine ADP-ribosyltransferase family protein [Rathayibacter tanaceti]|uniref:DarT domain-containing protein n=1 Tax=Rathayibacter tanaceti TaxID=1671680 RepID=A0A162GTN2_9MICO|nr:DarT ssDNA thymidine ADP-ribosyltransferase family protein [Rathayibacter tanaceti]KZX22438.1 hypothetical protein ACH61_00419 [Rathayibacter tanaceti]